MQQKVYGHTASPTLTTEEHRDFLHSNKSLSEEYPPLGTPKSSQTEQVV